MVELKIQSSTDREKLVVALANSGYGVKVVEKPHPTRYMSTEYYVQISEVENKPDVINVYTTIKTPSPTDASEFAERVRQVMEHGGSLNMLY